MVQNNRTLLQRSRHVSLQGTPVTMPKAGGLLGCAHCVYEKIYLGKVRRFLCSRTIKFCRPGCFFYNLPQQHNVVKWVMGSKVNRLQVV